MSAAVDPGIIEAWLASTEDGAVAIDASGVVVLHNPAASRVTGLAPADAGGRSWREVLQLSDAAADLVSSVRSTHRSIRTYTDVLCAQGNLRSAELVAHPWADTGGQVGILVLIRDIRVLCRHHAGPGGRPGYGSLVGADPAMEALYDLVEAVAPSDAPVVIEGEPGTGKELVAQLLHARSARAERPLIAVDCASLAPALLESEMFGQARNPVPGAGAGIGRVELAHTGTLFLDRVNEAPPAVQHRLARLLATGTLERGGETAVREVDVRVIAATTVSLAAATQERRFSADLLHRLQVVRVELPPLRQRRGDIPLLVEHFLERLGAGIPLSDAAVSALQAHDWPGNVRQLENAVRQALAARSPHGDFVLGAEHLPRGLASRPPLPRVGRRAPGADDRRTLLLRALSSHGGNRTAAARALGIGRATFYRWWREAGLGDQPRA